MIAIEIRVFDRLFLNNAPSIDYQWQTLVTLPLILSTANTHIPHPDAYAWNVGVEESMSQNFACCAVDLGYLLNDLRDECSKDWSLNPLARRSARRSWKGGLKIAPRG